jgi:hypothetical protein
VIRWVWSLMTWWQRRQVLNAVVAALEQGEGISEAHWPPGTEVAMVLAWFDDQLAAARRPYGLQACIVAAAPLDTPSATIQYVVGRSSPWWGGVRDTMAANLPSLLSTSGLKTTVVSFGSAAYAALANAKH